MAEAGLSPINNLWERFDLLRQSWKREDTELKNAFEKGGLRGIWQEAQRLRGAVYWGLTALALAACARLGPEILAAVTPTVEPVMPTPTAGEFANESGNFVLSPDFGRILRAELLDQESSQSGNIPEVTAAVQRIALSEGIVANSVVGIRADVENGQEPNGLLYALQAVDGRRFLVTGSTPDASGRDKVQWVGWNENPLIFWELHTGDPEKEPMLGMIQPNGDVAPVFLPHINSVDLVLPPGVMANSVLMDLGSNDNARGFLASYRVPTSTPPAEVTVTITPEGTSTIQASPTPPRTATNVPTATDIPLPTRETLPTYSQCGTKAPRLEGAGRPIGADGRGLPTGLEEKWEYKNDVFTLFITTACVTGEPQPDPNFPGKALRVNMSFFDVEGNMHTYPVMIGGERPDGQAMDVNYCLRNSEGVSCYPHPLEEAAAAFSAVYSSSENRTVRAHLVLEDNAPWSISDEINGMRVQYDQLINALQTGRDFPADGSLYLAGWDFYLPRIEIDAADGSILR